MKSPKLIIKSNFLNAVKMNRHVKWKPFVWLSLFVFLAATQVMAQEKKITIKVENASLKEVFNVIENQTSYRFSYRDVIIDTMKNISISKTDAEVASVLDETLKDRKLKYTIVSAKSIVISDKRQAAGTAGDQGKRRIVSGIVTDVNDEPVIGASVVEKGVPANGTSTGSSRWKYRPMPRWPFRTSDMNRRKWPLPARTNWPSRWPKA